MYMGRFYISWWLVQGQISQLATFFVIRWSDWLGAVSFFRDPRPGIYIFSCLKQITRRAVSIFRAAGVRTNYLSKRDIKCGVVMVVIRWLDPTPLSHAFSVHYDLLSSPERLYNYSILDKWSSNFLQSYTTTARLSRIASLHVLRNTIIHGGYLTFAALPYLTPILYSCAWRKLVACIILSMGYSY